MWRGEEVVWPDEETQVTSSPLAVILSDPWAIIICLFARVSVTSRDMIPRLEENIKPDWARCRRDVGCLKRNAVGGEMWHFPRISIGNYQFNLMESDVSCVVLNRNNCNVCCRQMNKKHCIIHSGRNKNDISQYGNIEPNGSYQQLCSSKPFLAGSIPVLSLLDLLQVILFAQGHN